MKERTITQIDEEIKETKNALKNVRGTETEVYARIVGYYRSIRNWNKGKKDEYFLRKMFKFLEDNIRNEEAKEAEEIKKDSLSSIDNTSFDGIPVSYEIYTRKTCPNCPPVKSYMADVNLEARSIDVDTDEGLQEAARKGVFAAPTVIFYDGQGNELSRCHSVEELEGVFAYKN